MIVAPTVLEVRDNNGEIVLSYVTRVNNTWFAISMLEDIRYVFEVHDEVFALYASNMGKEMLLDEVPEDIYKCLMAAFLVIAEDLLGVENH